MRSRVLRAGFLLVLVGLSPSDPPASAQSFGDRDTDFRITLVRQTDDVPRLFAELVTTATYPCEGYRVRTRVTWEKDTISIWVIGMVQPSPCFHAGSEARGVAYLGNPGPGSYVLRIGYRGETDLHAFTFSKKYAVTIRPLRSNFTTLRGS